MKTKIKRMILSVMALIMVFTIAGKFVYSASTASVAGISYESAIKQTKPILLLFYTKSCHACIKFMPKFMRLSREYGTKYNIVMINAQNPTYKDLYRKYDLNSVPCLIVIDPETNRAEKIPFTIYFDDIGLREYLDR